VNAKHLQRAPRPQNKTTDRPRKVSALPKQGARYASSAEALKNFAAPQRGPPLFANIKTVHVRKAVGKMPNKEKVDGQPSGVEEQLPKWAQILLELKAQVNSNQPAQTQDPEKGRIPRLVHDLIGPADCAAEADGGAQDPAAQVHDRRTPGRKRVHLLHTHIGVRQEGGVKKEAGC